MVLLQLYKFSGESVGTQARLIILSTSVRFRPPPPNTKEPHLAIFTPKDLYNANNNMRLREIFHEYNPDALLTTDKNGREGKVCLFKLYIAHCVDDPSEVTFAEEVFGDIFFWQCLCEANWFQRHISEWRLIAATIRKRDAFKSIVKEVKEGGRSSFSAAKYLIEEPWKMGNAAERKKNKKLVSDTAEAAFSDSTIQQDIRRLKEEGVIN